LLARRIHRVVRLVGAKAAALVTGEEKIVPPGARYFLCTVEAMPESQADFLAVDEIQLAADPDRGHVFTERLLHARGREETMFVGADDPPSSP
jgi:ATP-dependent RNA helicase SUPV3L1/SUV3